MKKKLTAVLALCLAFCLALSGTFALAADKGVLDSSEEVIYALLGPDGAPESAYAVVILNVSKAGEVTHYGDYSAVKNLTDSAGAEYKDGAVTLTAPEGRFYYQGQLSELELPWSVDVSYKLDGRAVAPEELGGASGALEISIATARNAKADAGFFENYLLQVSVPLDTVFCRNIEAEGATLANSGGDKLVTFTVLPGAEGDMTVTADVTDFAMDGITVSAVPYDAGGAVGDVSELTGGLGDLADGVSQLSDGVSDLSAGTTELSVGAAMLKNGALTYGDGLLSLSAGSAGIISASEQINGALRQISGGLSGQGGGVDLSAMAQLPAGLRQLAEGLSQVSAGMTALHEGYTAAYAALSAAVEDIPAPSVSEADLGALMAANPGSAALTALIANYTAAQTVRGVWQQTSAAFAAVDANLPQLCASAEAVAASLQDIAAQTEAAMQSSQDLSGLMALAQGISELSGNYAQFHAGLAEYTGGVDALAQNWSSVEEGVKGLATGSRALAKGAEKLSEGAGALSEETSAIPEQVDEMVGSLSGGDYEPESFLSGENESCRSVQFVIKTAAIERPAAEASAPPASAPNTLWQRIKDLFAMIGIG